MESSLERRKRLDHERYMRNREERLAKQHDYYIANRDAILAKVNEKRQAERLAKPQKVKFQFDVERRRAYNREWYRKNKNEKINEAQNQNAQAAKTNDARPIQKVSGTVKDYAKADCQVGCRRTDIAV